MLTIAEVEFEDGRDETFHVCGASNGLYYEVVVTGRISCAAFAALNCTHIAQQFGGHCPLT